MTIIVVPMNQKDIEIVSLLHSQAFPRQLHSEEWIRCNFAAFPRIIIFVARNEEDQIVDYIQWLQKR